MASYVRIVNKWFNKLTRELEDVRNTKIRSETNTLMKQMGASIAKSAEFNIRGRFSSHALSIKGNMGLTRAAVLTEVLADSIEWRVDRSGSNGTSLYSLRVWTNVPYAWYIHEGFKSYPPNPFLTSALQTSLPRLRKRLQDLMPFHTMEVF